MHGLLRAVWVATAAAVVGAAIAAIVTVVRGQPGEADVKAVYSLVAVFLCGGAAIAALHLIERQGLRVLGALVLIAAAVELFLLELGVWKGVFFDGESSGYVKLVPSVLAWAIATIVIATLPLVAGDRRIVLASVAFVGASALAGATVATAMVWREVDSTGWAKTLAVLAILMVAGYLLTPIAERLLRTQARRA